MHRYTEIIKIAFLIALLWLVWPHKCLSELEMTYPPDGGHIVAGYPVGLQWTGAGPSDTCSVYYRTDKSSNWSPIVEDSVGISSYRWNVPGDLETGSIRFKIIVKSANGSETNLLYSHDDQVRDIIWSSLNSEIISTGDDGVVRIWDRSQNEVVYTMKYYNFSPVNSISLASDGIYLAGGGDQDLVAVWDTRSEQLLRSFSGHLTGDEHTITHVCWNREKDMIASLSTDNKIILWEASTGFIITEITGIGGEQNAIAFSPDGSKLAAGGSDKILRIINPDNGKVINSSEEIDNNIISIKWQADGSRIAAGTDGGQVVLYTGDEELSPIKYSFSDLEAIPFLDFTGNGILLFAGPTTGIYSISKTGKVSQDDSYPPLNAFRVVSDNELAFASGNGVYLRRGIAGNSLYESDDYTLISCKNNSLDHEYILNNCYANASEIAGDSLIIGRDPFPGYSSNIWLTDMLPVGKVFSTEFRFSIPDNDNNDFEGFTFMLHNGSMQVTGTPGPGLGAADISHCLAIEFDFKQNPETSDPATPHVAMFSGDTSGLSLDHSSAQLIQSAELKSMEDGKWRYVRIEYNINNNEFNVYADDSGALYSPLLSVSDLNIAQMLDMDSYHCRLSFTGTSGSGYAVIDDWSVCPAKYPGLDAPSGGSGNKTEVRICPNPVRSANEFEMIVSLKDSGPVQIEIYDMLGRYREMLYNSKLPAGDNHITMQLDDYSSGLYFVTVKSGGKTIIEKLVYHK